ncbi:DUF2645 family protein [Kalamiella sp. sgz302252]|uniref:DUF2645 family protein n=1 Tax=Pantoea sp. sgz302252 TaxID=3341827 RepID=UPI0036D421AE
MNKNIAMQIVFIMYALFICLWCVIGGTLKEESFINGEEIKDVCDVLRYIVVDDYRETMAIASLIAISPVLIYSCLKKMKLPAINIILLFFLITWLWNFIFKYQGCLWF